MGVILNNPVEIWFRQKKVIIGFQFHFEFQVAIDFENIRR